MRLGRLKYQLRLLQPLRTVPGTLASLTLGGLTAFRGYDAAFTDESGLPLGLRWAERSPALAPALTALHRNADTLSLALLIVAALLLGLHLIDVIRGRFVARPGQRYAARLVEGLDETRDLQRQLVKRFFPNSPMPRNAMAAQAKNKERLIGLFDGESLLVGYCALWPVTREAGERIRRGEITDDDLTVDDLLPHAENLAATHIVIVGIGVLPEVRAVNPFVTARLIRKVQEVLCEKYLGEDSRELLLLATAYSRAGERLCGLFGMEWDGQTTVVYAHDERRFALVRRLLAAAGLYRPHRHSVFTKRVTQRDVLRADPTREWDA